MWSSQAEHQFRQETLEHGLKRHGKSPHTAPVLSKPPLPKGSGIERLGTRPALTAHRPHALRHLSEPLQALGPTCRRGQLQLNPSPLARLRSPRRGQSSAPAASDHRDPSFASPGLQHIPPAPHAPAHRNQRQEESQVFPVFKLPATAAGNTAATSHPVLTPNNRLCSANPLQPQAPPAGCTPSPRPGCGTAATALPSHATSTATDLGAFSGPAAHPKTARLRQ